MRGSILAILYAVSFLGLVGVSEAWVRGNTSTTSTTLPSVLSTTLNTGRSRAKSSPPPSSSSSTRLYGVASTLRRARDSLLDRERSREDLKIGIAGFYDRSSKLWEDVWGEVRAWIGL